MIQKVSAVSTTKIGVYWNQICTDTVTSINWGSLSPGENKNITLYVQNEDNTTIILAINATNWNPEEAHEFLAFSWTPTNATIDPQKVAKITLTLEVKQNTTDLTDFSFDILFEGKDQTLLPTDLNKDGIVDSLDLVIVASAYGSKPGDANWNEIADIDNNGCINIYDFCAVAKDLGKTP